MSIEVGDEQTKYAVKNAPVASVASSHGRLKTDLRCGTRDIFRLVMNPNMKYKIVMVINGPV
jgi:hypothetical protein